MFSSSERKIGTIRKANIKVVTVDDGATKVVKTDLDFSRDLPGLKKMMEIFLRISPSDPHYNIQKVCLKMKGNNNVEITPENLNELRPNILKLDKILLTVVVTCTPSGIIGLREKKESVLQDNNSEQSHINNEIKRGSIFFGKPNLSVPSNGRMLVPVSTTTNTVPAPVKKNLIPFRFDVIKAVRGDYKSRSQQEVPPAISTPKDIPPVINSPFHSRISDAKQVASIIAHDSKTLTAKKAEATTHDRVLSISNNKPIENSTGGIAAKLHLLSTEENDENQNINNLNIIEEIKISSTNNMDITKMKSKKLGGHSNPLSKSQDYSLNPFSSVISYCKTLINNDVSNSHAESSSFLQMENSDNSHNNSEHTLNMADIYVSRVPEVTVFGRDADNNLYQECSSLSSQIHNIHDYSNSIDGVCSLTMDSQPLYANNNNNNGDGNDEEEIYDFKVPSGRVSIDIKQAKDLKFDDWMTSSWNDQEDVEHIQQQQPVASNGSTTTTTFGSSICGPDYQEVNNEDAEDARPFRQSMGFVTSIPFAAFDNHRTSTVSKISHPFFFALDEEDEEEFEESQEAALGVNMEAMFQRTKSVPEELMVQEVVAIVNIPPVQETPVIVPPLVPFTASQEVSSSAATTSTECVVQGDVLDFKTPGKPRQKRSTQSTVKRHRVQKGDNMTTPATATRAGRSMATPSNSSLGSRHFSRRDSAYADADDDNTPPKERGTIAVSKSKKSREKGGTEKKKGMSSSSSTTTTRMRSASHTQQQPFHDVNNSIVENSNDENSLNVSTVSIGQEDSIAADMQVIVDSGVSSSSSCNNQMIRDWPAHYHQSPLVGYRDSIDMSCLTEVPSSTLGLPQSISSSVSVPAPSQQLLPPPVRRAPSSRKTEKRLDEGVKKHDKKPEEKERSVPFSPPGNATMMTTISMSPDLETGRTTAEEVNNWVRGLRSMGNDKSSHKGRQRGEKKGRGERGDKDGKERYYSKSGGRKSTHSPSMMRAMRTETELNMSGRPSLGTMTAQWEFLKTTFVNSEEELEWLMVSKKTGAYKYAKDKSDAAEDRYFKSLFDMDVLDAKLKLLQGSAAQLPIIINDIITASFPRPIRQQDANENDDDDEDNEEEEERNSKVDLIRLALKELLVVDLQHMFSSEFESELVIISEHTDIQIVIDKAKYIKQFGIPEEIKRINARLIIVKKGSEETLVEMEKWKTREKETDEYEKVLKDEESKWFEKEKEANEEALRIMRSFIPVNVAELSLSELQSNTKHSFWPLELISEIKNNKLLHWIVTHPDDIAWSSFLTGDKRQFFENLEGLDVIELRALCLCVCSKFELDGDGKKMEWRSRLIARTKQLVAQCNRERVKGGWSAELNKRSEVELPPLKADQARRPVYFYRTKAQLAVRLKQFEDRAALLKKKEGWLLKAETTYKEAKVEYDTILLESRDVEFRNHYGAEKINAAKDMAKKEFNDAESKMKTLTSDVNRLKKSLSETPITGDQIKVSMEELQLYLWDAYDIDWCNATSATQVIGIFDSHPEIVRRERNAAKFVTAEEEAEQRKNEIASIKARKDAPTPSVTTNALSLATESAVESLATPRKLFSSADGSSIGESDEHVPIIASVPGHLTTETDAPPATPCTPRMMPRQSVLTNLNPDLLLTLNSMMSAGGKGRPMPPLPPTRSYRNRQTTAAVVKFDSLMPDKSSEESGSSATEEKPKVIKRTKSKLLKRIAGGLSPPRNTIFGGGAGIGSSAGGATPGLSFMDQIKARAAGGGGGLPAPPAAGMSFLDQLKMKSKRIE